MQNLRFDYRLPHRPTIALRLLAKKRHLPCLAPFGSSKRIGRFWLSLVQSERQEMSSRFQHVINAKDDGHRLLLAGQSIYI
jgi:hypothetical protein